MLTNNPIRWAILGPGKIAHSFARDFNAVKNAKLVAVASRDRERARAFAARYQIPHVYSYEELYTSDHVDAVYIATPHTFHFEQSRACLEHGKAVLCEKPITINDSEFKNLAAIAREKEVFLMEALWTYFLPALQRAKAWIAEGRIGNMKLIQADFGYRMEMNPAGRMYSPALAGGALLDLGIYPIALSTFLMQRKPDDVQAFGIIGSTAVDETAAMVLHYGSTAAILHTTLLAKTLNKGYIFGDKGFIEIPDFYKANAALLYNEERVLIDSFIDDRTTLGYNFEIQEATDCILAGKMECEGMTHVQSNTIQEIMTEVRRQIGLKYPMEK
jgi:predicted dehydrogenase